MGGEGREGWGVATQFSINVKLHNKSGKVTPIQSQGEGWMDLLNRDTFLHFHSLEGHCATFGSV